MAPVTLEGSAADVGYTRLHITPLNAALLSAIIPPTILSCARNISYHSLQSFPEKDFGFVDLPSMEAEKIKKKLTGSILKGKKIEIEEARPSKLSKRMEETSQSVGKVRKSKGETSKKRKRDEDTIQGVELEGRRVKRGWTDSTVPKKKEKTLKDKKDKKDKKTSIKSKYSSGPELLFRTSVPSNIAVAASEQVVGDLDARTERRTRRKNKENIIVHEFAKTAKYPTFLRESGAASKGKGTSEFVEGKGWVDHEGNLVEAAAKSAIVQAEESSSADSEDSDVGSDQDGGKSDEESASARQDIRSITIADFKKRKMEDSSTSSPGSSSAEEADSDSSSNSGEEGEDTKSKPDSQRPMSSSGTPVGLAIAIPTEATPEKQKIHPLEALYKRRRPGEDAPQQELPSFAFFNDDIDVDGNDSEAAIPMTPFTRQDFAARGLRSAAPTPDTANPGKSYAIWPTNASKEDNDSQTHTPVVKPSSSSDLLADSSSAPVSDFQKWFYEHQGETNRAWKKQRKLAAKEKRQRENRKTGERAA